MRNVKNTHWATKTEDKIFLMITDQTNMIYEHQFATVEFDNIFSTHVNKVLNLFNNYIMSRSLLTIN